jgi:hypothetical protein
MNNNVDKLLLKIIYQYFLDNHIYIYEGENFHSYISRKEIKVSNKIQDKVLMLDFKTFENKVKYSNLLEKILKEKDVFELWCYLSKQPQMKNIILKNMDDITQGYWKKDMNKYLDAISSNLNEKMNILLNFSNSKLSINKKNLNNIAKIIDSANDQEKINFWKSFFEKRKITLNNNKGATSFMEFIQNNFSTEIIKKEFINLSKYTNNLFSQKKEEQDLFEKNKNHIILIVNPKKIEDILLIPNLSVQKIKQQIYQIMNLLSNAKNFTFETIEKSFQKDIKIVIELKDNTIHEEKIKKIINGYLWELKQSQKIDLLPNEEIFKKWLLQHELNEELKSSENKKNNYLKI